MDDARTSAAPSELSRLFREARNGSEEAAQQIVTRYSGAIRRTVRHMLHSKLRAKFDTCDFEQAVWASVFGENAQLGGMQSSSELMKFLVRMARNKVIDEYRRRLHSRKRNVNQEQSLNSPGAGDLAVDRGTATPSQHAIAEEEIDRLLAEQPGRYGRVLKLRQQGKTYQEIAADEQINERTARRNLRRLRSRWGTI